MAASSWLTVLRELFAQRKSLTPLRQRRTTLHVETLEARLPLAVNVSFVNGELSIVGDNANNTIVLKRAPNGRLLVTSNTNIVATGGTPTINNVASIAIDGKGGNDVITLKETGGPLPRVTIHGGKGNDTIRSGSAADVLFGDAGNDKIFGADGDDTIDGGAGNDMLNGGAGDDMLTGANGNDKLVGAAGDDELLAGPGRDVLDGGAGSDQESGGTGNDTYNFDPDDFQGVDDLIELPGEGADTLKFAAATTVGVTVDLGLATQQQVANTLALRLSAADTFENAIGGSLDDTLIGNTNVNRFTGGAGKDTFVHHGSGDGIDIVTDMQSSEVDQVSFVTGGLLSAKALTIDSTATQLRDDQTQTFGFNFILPVLSSSSLYIFGRTDTTSNGQMLTFNANGGISQGSIVDSLVASYISSSTTIAGADANDRLIDFSPNGNTLLGRSGDDILDGGAGNDTLNGDRGLSGPGNDILIGGLGDDTFVFGEGFGGVVEAFGNDTVADFGLGADKVRLATGLTVASGLGTTVVTIKMGGTTFGTITAGKGHLWAAGDFI